MPKPYRHPKLGRFHKFDVSKGNIGRVLVPDAAFADLVQFLNSAEEDRGCESVVSILRAMLELQKLPHPVWGSTEERDILGDKESTVMRDGKWVPNPILEKVVPDKYRMEMEIADRQFHLNRELAQHTFLPQVYHMQGGPWVVTWQVLPRGRKSLQRPAGAREIDDAMALQMILDFARAGYLDRLRSCSCCRKWLYAKFSHQTFCSTKCQQKHYAQSGEWKKKRREYMRWYRDHS